MREKRRMERAGGFRDGLEDTFGFGGKYTDYMSRIFDALILGLCWILCSLPVFTMGAASCALYHGIVKCVKKDRSRAVKEFFRSFRENFRQATILWVPDLAVMALMLWNMHILISSDSSSYLFLFLTVVYGFIFMFALPASVYELSALSRFAMPTKWFVRFSAYVTVRHLGTTLMLLVIFALLSALVWRFPFLFFAMPGAAVFLISEFTEKILDAYSPEGGTHEDMPK